jgi:curli production assembly/transport component CsgF
MMKTRHTCTVVACSLAFLAQGTSATELVYCPVNPSFGGSPLNASGLLGSASSTNKHNVSASSMFNQTPLEQFNQTLERMVLGQLASSATSKFIGTDGKLIAGTFTTTNFNITIADLGGGSMRITTVDKATGATTSFEVSQ